MMSDMILPVTHEFEECTLIVLVLVPQNDIEIPMFCVIVVSRVVNHEVGSESIRLLSFCG